MLYQNQTWDKWGSCQENKTKQNVFFLFLPKGMGLINSVFNADSLKKLYVANLGIGHTRYSTSGISELQNCQPFVVETLHGKIAVAHNGELTNAVRLRRKVSISIGRLWHCFFLSMRQQWAISLLWLFVNSRLVGLAKECLNQNNLGRKKSCEGEAFLIVTNPLDGWPHSS